MANRPIAFGSDMAVRPNALGSSMAVRLNILKIFFMLLIFS